MTNQLNVMGGLAPGGSSQLMSRVVHTLPDGWVATTLGEICLVNPHFFTEPVQDDREVSFVPMAAVEAGTGRMDSTRTRPYRDVRSGYTRFAEGDVLFAKITPSMENGKVAVARDLTNGSGCGSTEFHVLRPFEGVYGNLLPFFLLQDAFRGEARSHMAGTAGQLRVPAGFLEEAAFPLPPLAEQHRIVAEIEKQLTRLDASVAALKRVQANLKRYRASVLKAACEGRLVPTEAELARAEGRDYEPADRLLQRILAERRARWESQQNRRGKYKEPTAPDTSNLPELPEGWVWATLGETADVIRGVSFPKNARRLEPQTGHVACLRTANVQREIEWGDLWFVPEKYIKLESRYVQHFDVLISVSNSLELVGKVAQVTNLPQNSTLGAFISLLRFSSRLDPKFCYYQMASPEVQAGIRHSASTTTNISNISSSKLSWISLIFPPLAEQRRIVAEVERRLSVIQQAEAAVEANLARADRLRQSILKQAFSGKLVPQDPDDEPASVLLQRIRAEREAAEADARSKRKPKPRRSKKAREPMRPRAEEAS